MFQGFVGDGEQAHISLPLFGEGSHEWLDKVRPSRQWKSPVLMMEVELGERSREDSRAESFTGMRQGFDISENTQSF